MKGQVKFRIYDKDNEYRFTLKRNITIIQGESGTGKTTLLHTLWKRLPIILFIPEHLRNYDGKPF